MTTVYLTMLLGVIYVAGVLSGILVAHIAFVIGLFVWSDP